MADTKSETLTKEQEHKHVWLPANDGKELVCGDCQARKKV